MPTDRRQEAALFFAGWWPGTRDEHDGIFVKEHALALRPRVPVAVVHITLERTFRRLPSIHLDERTEDGIHVVRGWIRTPVRRFGLHDRLVRLAYSRALRILEQHYRFPFIHVHVRTPVTENALWFAKARKLPVVVTEHSSFYHRGINLRPEPARSAEMARVSRWFAHPSVKAVLPVSQDLGCILNNTFGVPDNMLIVVPNSAAPVFRPATVPNAKPFRIVLAARWAPPKDPMLFLEAVQKLPPAMLRPEALRIDWVGDGELVAEAKAKCMAWVGSGLVHFHGRLPKDRLADLLGHAHLLVHPTKAENLPCIILESLACGTPVLSHAVNGIPEMIGPTNGLLCPPMDADAFARALLKAMQEPGLFDRRAITLEARKKYSREAVADGFLSAYATVLKRPFAEG